jgi:hypothetical protein
MLEHKALELCHPVSLKYFDQNQRDSLLADPSSWNYKVDSLTKRIVTSQVMIQILILAKSQLSIV